MKNIFILLILVVGLNTAAQVAINADVSAPHNSAMDGVSQPAPNGEMPMLRETGPAPMVPGTQP